MNFLKFLRTPFFKRSPSVTACHVSFLKYSKFLVPKNICTHLSLNHEFTSDYISFKKDLRVDFFVAIMSRIYFVRLMFPKEYSKTYLVFSTRLTSYFIRRSGFSMGLTYKVLLIVRDVFPDMSHSYYFFTHYCSFLNQYLPIFKSGLPIFSLILCASKPVFSIFRVLHFWNCYHFLIS